MDGFLVIYEPFYGAWWKNTNFLYALLFTLDLCNNLKMELYHSLWIIVTMTSYKMSAMEVPAKGKRSIGNVLFFKAIVTARTLYISKLALQCHNGNTDDSNSQEKEVR